MKKPYRYKNCQSLFGYAMEIHKRCNFSCQLCGCGGNEPSDFDIWRQLSVEHIIGKSQGGYQAEIRNSINARFPNIPANIREALSQRLNDANTISACRFCNSMTSRAQHSNSMHELILKAKGDPEEVANEVISELDKILQNKKIEAKWKIKAVRIAFDENVSASVVIKA